MTKPVSYKRHRFPPQIIAHAIWLYFRLPLSLRLVEEMLLERGIVVSYETIRRWGKKFGPEYAQRLRRFRRKYSVSELQLLLSRFSDGGWHVQGQAF
jgi:transposase-like protein